MSINSITEFSKREVVLDLDGFKARFLHGVDLRDADGNDIEDDAIQAILDISIDYIEHELNCPMVRKSLVYYEDYNFKNYSPIMIST